jgi:hypothetical protein
MLHLILLFLLSFSHTLASGFADEDAAQFMLAKREECFDLHEQVGKDMLAQEEVFFTAFSDDEQLKSYRKQMLLAEQKKSAASEQTKYKWVVKINELRRAVIAYGDEHNSIKTHPDFLAHLELAFQSYFYHANKASDMIVVGKVFYPLLSLVNFLYRKDCEDSLGKADLRMLSNVFGETQKLIAINKEELTQTFKTYRIDNWSNNKDAFPISSGLDKRKALAASTMTSQVFTELCLAPLESWMYRQLKAYDATSSSGIEAPSQKENVSPQPLTDEELIAQFARSLAVTNSSNKPKGKKSGKVSPTLAVGKQALSSRDVDVEVQEAPDVLEFGREPVGVLIKIGNHTIAQPLRQEVYECDADFEQFCTVQGSQIVVSDHRIHAAWKVIDDVKENTLVTLKLNEEAAADMPDWICQGNFAYHARVKGEWSRKDYRHKFPFLIDKHFLPCGTYSLRENGEGVLEPHVEINACIQHRNSKTGKVTSTLKCVLEYTFDEATHTCYHRFARS